MIEVHVTQEDIDNGSRANCQRCPLALAIARAAGTRPENVSVAGTIVIDPLGFTDTPPSARDFWSDFDHGRPVWPFSFTISLR